MWKRLPQDSPHTATQITKSNCKSFILKPHRQDIDAVFTPIIMEKDGSASWIVMIKTKAHGQETAPFSLLGIVVEPWF
jgi:hypothetical protein